MPNQRPPRQGSAYVAAAPPPTQQQRYHQKPNRRQRPRTVAPPRDFTALAWVALVLYIFVWPLGALMNLVWYMQATSERRRTRQTVHGLGCLMVLFWVCIGGPVLMVVAAVAVPVVMGVQQYADDLDVEKGELANPSPWSPVNTDAASSAAQPTVADEPIDRSNLPWGLTKAEYVESRIAERITALNTLRDSLGDAPLTPTECADESAKVERIASHEWELAARAIED